MSDPAVKQAFVEYRATRDRNLRNWLVEQHGWLAAHCARRFAQRGEPADDLVQVANVGVIKAVERFDPSYGTTFATFAIPTVMGELRRHFRDSTWSIHVPRSVKDRYLEVRRAVERLTHRLERSPTAQELADELSLTVEEALEALDAGTNYRPIRLAPPVETEGGGEEAPTEGDSLGAEDAGIAHAELRAGLRGALVSLSSRDQEILYLRYFEELTQSEIATRIGISQVHVSRLLRSSLAMLQTQLREATAAAEAV
jgi:RNA polymerase sigma-B factor